MSMEVYIMNLILCKVSTFPAVYSNVTTVPSYYSTNVIESQYILAKSSTLC